MYNVSLSAHTSLSAPESTLANKTYRELRIQSVCTHMKRSHFYRELPIVRFEWKGQQMLGNLEMYKKISSHRLPGEVFPLKSDRLLWAWVPDRQHALPLVPGTSCGRRGHRVDLRWTTLELTPPQLLACVRRGHRTMPVSGWSPQYLTRGLRGLQPPLAGRPRLRKNPRVFAGGRRGCSSARTRS